MQILNLYEREKIAFYRRCKLSLRDIAKRLHRDPGVICRELRRNKSRDGTYVAAEAQARADRRARKTNHRKLETDDQLHDFVEDQLRAGWSPQLIAGRLKNTAPKAVHGATVSHEQIYQYIYDGHGRQEGWYRFLERKHGRRRRQQDRKKQAKTLINERVSIHDRPALIDERQRYGDWESDLALFRKQQTALSVQYERKAMLTRIHKIANKTADENEQAITKTLESVPPHLAQSLTQDNGLEGTCHMTIRDTFELDTFFCDPYAAWQKGGVENTIGLIRRHLPKKTDLATISDADIYAIQETINNRPRKKLNYLTPNEVWGVALNS
jgi:IS30 family transposase